MQHWLTVHYPPDMNLDQTLDGSHAYARDTGIWVPEKWAERFDDLAQDDLVAIYQAKYDPSRPRSAYRRGLGGVVAIGRVKKRVRKKEDSGWIKLAVVEVSAYNPDGLPRAELNPMLGYQANARIRGGGGMRKISHSAFRKIEARLRA